MNFISPLWGFVYCEDFVAAIKARTGDMHSQEWYAK